MAAKVFDATSNEHAQRKAPRRDDLPVVRVRAAGPTVTVAFQIQIHAHVLLLLRHDATGSTISALHWASHAVDGVLYGTIDV